MSTDEDYDWREIYTDGEVDGYPSLVQLENVMAFLLFKYPDVLRRESIGESVEGRTIFAYKMFAESEKPLLEVPRMLLISLLHGSEPVTTLISVYTMGKILEDFRENLTDAQYLLRSRELHVIPLANPDAYSAGCLSGNFEYRKNRRKTCVENPARAGIDLNRNFGLYWSNETNFDPCHAEYGGPFPFSEPETRAIYDYAWKYSFKSVLLLHSFGEIIAYPFNGDSSASVSDTHKSFYHGLQKAFGIEKSGPSMTVLKYPTFGEATDFLYANMSTVALSLEAGPESDGFLPPIDRAVFTATKNSERIRYWMLKSGHEITAMSTTIEDDIIAVRFENTGLTASGDAIELTTVLSTADELTEFHSLTIEGGTLKPGWSDPVRLDGFGDEDSFDHVCLVEMGLLCRCFPVHDSLSDSVAGITPISGDHESFCNRLGFTFAIISGDTDPEPVVRLDAYILGILGIISLLGIFFLRAARRSFII